jgi:tRNA threonylcarbamoyladenosine biosynthesis protein TsaE
MLHTAVTIRTDSVDETIDLGRRIGAALDARVAVGLVGDLGAGKTHLVRGIALGNGLSNPSDVASPTFVLVKEYTGKMPLYHLDAYRLTGDAELSALGFEEMLEEDAAVVIEWADRVRSLIPDDALWITITSPGETVRRFNITSTGELSYQVLDKIMRTSPSAQHFPSEL